MDQNEVKLTEYLCFDQSINYLLSDKNFAMYMIGSRDIASQIHNGEANTYEARCHMSLYSHNPKVILTHGCSWENT